jgi:hypothetical protein
VLPVVSLDEAPAAGSLAALNDSLLAQGKVAAVG